VARCALFESDYIRTRTKAFEPVAPSQSCSDVERHGVMIVHYDGDYDTVSDITG